MDRWYVVVIMCWVYAVNIAGSGRADAASLRLALLVLAPSGFWAVYHFCMARRTIVADQQRAVGYVTVPEGFAGE